MQILQSDLKIARQAAQAGAQILIKRFGETSNARNKGNSKGLVTDTDLEAEKAILQILREQTNYGILSEESGLSGIESGPKWVVDPLDGTNNFARSMTMFGISVALVDGAEVLLGVIIDPIHKNEMYAIKGEGAFYNEKKLTLTKFNKDFTPALFLNHGYDKTDRNKFKMLASRLATTYDILKLGTTVMELFHIAKGSVDAFICSGDELWDFAAGAVITQEAGAIFTDWKGNRWDGKDNHLLISRPEIHSDLIEIIKDLQ